MRTKQNGNYYVERAGIGGSWYNKVSKSKYYQNVAINVVTIAFFIYVGIQFILTIPEVM